MASDLRRVTRALLSVSDKAGLVALARLLAGRGIQLVSTGGTAKALKDAGLEVVDVAELTGFPEMMDGRLKTLHPKVHGGLLAIRENPEHEAAMLAHGIEAIDLLVVNLYPFEQMLGRAASFEACVENIDIGGPAMIRGAAKNHADVAVVVDPADYADISAELEAHDGATTLGLRRRLAAKAYARTAAYDAAISNWLLRETGLEAPRAYALGGLLAQALRYGENPHQKAGFYRLAEPRFGVATARQVQGKELSYNNINDTDAAIECVAEFDPEDAVCAIVKHANPCGVAIGTDLVDAYCKALRCDSTSAFGGIVAVNRKLDRASATAIAGMFTEVVVAPDADEEALAVFAAKKNLRLLLTKGLPDPAAPGLAIRSVGGGFLVQSRDAAVLGDVDLKTVTRRAPTRAELDDLKFAWRVCKHVRSNAIVYAKGGASVGIGAGQMSRVDAARIAAWKAAEAARAAGLDESLAKGAVVASDAFFPFADGLLATINAGATAVIQPGGSVRDQDVIAAADAAGVAMVFTGLRHFRH
ncbi:MAG: bifunctional phosphoribosylaminoimidazolecarboxamide formyltransferase/IMP cyclohydrolase [Hyphomicrobiales bacterium]|nr:bifunctional phosphoribosylaminoimidazolecarboxamide formyltransferase/IMP cyclohydrolase [Hyphomicrobiales bacterium]MBV9975227.1 bifunctional phosphoribosylaminoimidazolecarboxamide formyltransferase/IMP cyclohydrolase [Hyphomicrobiales bacterium]